MSRLGLGVTALCIGLAAVSGEGATGDATAPPARDTAASASGYLEQLQARHQLPRRPYLMPERLLRPYAGGSLPAVLSFSLVDGTNVVDAPAVQALAQGVVDRELAQWPGSHPDRVPVIVIAKGSYGAHADRTGTINVNLGTFDADPNQGAASVDELALLLGHELSHILLGHIDAKSSMQGVANGLRYAATGFVGYSALDRTHMVGRTVTYAGNAALTRQGLAGGLAATTLASDILKPSFNRDQESAADRSGVDLAHRAGFVVGTEEANRFVLRHQADDRRISLRMARLGAQADDMATAATKAATTSWTSALGGDAKQLAGGVEQQITDRIIGAIAARNVDHPDPQQRADALGAYVRQVYPHGDLAADGSIIARSIDDLDQITHDPATIDTLARVRRAEVFETALVEAMNAASKPSVRAATAPASQPGTRAATVPALPPLANVCALLKPAATPPRRIAARVSYAAHRPERDPGHTSPPAAPLDPQANADFGSPGAAMTWEVAGAADMICLRDPAAARTAYGRGTEVNYPSIVAAQLYGLAVQGTPAQAQLGDIVARYGRLIGTTDPLLDLRVSAAAARGDTAAAETEAARCANYNGGVLYAACARYLGYDPLALGTTAKTPAGQRAFALAKLQESLRGATALTKLFQ